MTDVLVVAELFEGKSTKASLAAVTFAKEVADGTSGAYDILVIGEGAAGAADGLAKQGARKVLRAEIAGHYVAENYAPTVAEVAKGGYGVIVAGATAYGKDLIPRVAGKIDAGVASDISDVAIDGGELHYTRPMYAGNVIGTLKLTTEIQAVTVRQSEFEALPDGDAASPIEDASVVAGEAEGKIEVVSIETVKSERPDLASADIVVSGGRGVASKENFEKVIEPLVDALGAAMGASRAACDAGYAPHELQVGQTGKVVAPKLYIAIGISGAIQHLAGMKGSKVIVAINKADPTDGTAPIAEVADYYLRQDLFEAAPALTEAIKSVKR